MECSSRACRPTPRSCPRRGGAEERVMERRRGLVGLALAGVMLIGLPVTGLGADSRESTAPSKAQDPDYMTAMKAIDGNNFAAAIPLLEGVVARDGNNADAYNSLAYAIRKNGDPARAIP